MAGSWQALHTPLPVGKTVVQLGRYKIGEASCETVSNSGENGASLNVRRLVELVTWLHFGVVIIHGNPAEGAPCHHLMAGSN